MTSKIPTSQEDIKIKKGEIRKKIEEYYTTPIEIKRIVDPNINSHGIYALIELSK